MKKLISVMGVVALLVTSMFAIDVAVGARGNVNFGLGTTLEGDGKELLYAIENYSSLVSLAGGKSTLKKGGNIGGGFGLYGNFGLMDIGSAKLGVQPELDFNFNNGYHINWSASANGTSASIDVNAYSHTLDIPVLVSVGVPLGKMFEVGFGLGPQLSFPMKADAEKTERGSGQSQTDKLSDNASKVTGSVNFGLALDANGKIFFGDKKNLGLVLDFRYNLDFTKTKIKVTSSNVTEEFEFYTRRGLNIGVGGEYRF